MSQPSGPAQGTMKRRALFAGAGTAGALAAVAALLPSVPEADAHVESTLKTPPERGGGYALTEHVKQYYQTTRV